MPIIVELQTILLYKYPQKCIRRSYCVTVKRINSLQMLLVVKNRKYVKWKHARMPIYYQLNFVLYSKFIYLKNVSKQIVFLAFDVAYSCTVRVLIS